MRIAIVAMVGFTALSLACASNPAGSPSPRDAAPAARVVLPDGYVDACAARADIRELFAAGQPPSGRLLGCLLDRADFEAWDDPEALPTAPVYILSSLRRHESREMSPIEFAAIADTFEQQQDRLFEAAASTAQPNLDRAAEEAANQFGEDFEMGEISVVPKGTFMRTSDRLGFAFVRSLTVSFEGSSVPTRSAIATLLLNQGGKLLIVSIEKDYVSEADLDDVRDRARSFADLQSL